MGPLRLIHESHTYFEVFIKDIYICSHVNLYFLVFTITNNAALCVIHTRVGIFLGIFRAVEVLGCILLTSS